MTASSSITVASGNTLNIYSQTNGTGTLTANGGTSQNAGIGGGHLLVFSGSSSNPTTVIFSPYSTRSQYMDAAKGYIVSFDKNSDNAAGTMSPLGVRASSPDLTLPENTFTLTDGSFDHWNTESDEVRLHVHRLDRDER